MTPARLPSLRAIGATLLGAAVLAAGAWAVWDAGRDALEREVERKLQTYAGIASQLVDGDDLDAVHSPLDVTRNEFWRVQSALAGVLRRAPDAKYVYTMRYTGRADVWEFVVDADPTVNDEDGDGVISADELPSLPGDTYEAGVDQPYLEAAHERAVVNMQFVETPPWGVLVTAYAPVHRRNGTVAGVIGIDVEQSTIVAKMAALKWSIIGAFAAIGLLLVVVSVLLGRVRRMYEQALVLQRELIHVKVQLAKFVPTSVLERIEENPDDPDLDKKDTDVTVLFLDVESYTKLSEVLSPDRLRLVVETYFSRFLDVIQSNAGDINETAGDGLMVIFQADDERAHAVHAALTAAAVQKETAALNEKLPPNEDPVRINIGIASGTAQVGSSRFRGAAGDRWTFTATGSVTNLAARLSGLALHGQVLMSDETARRVKGQIDLVDHGKHKLKNVSDPVQVYRLPRN